jgi:hypothetical protein
MSQQDHRRGIRTAHLDHPERLPREGAEQKDITTVMDSPDFRFVKWQ